MITACVELATSGTGLFTIWKIDDYNEAHAQPQQCVVELRRINVSATNSLREGFEQTLTLQGIGMNKLHNHKHTKDLITTFS